MRPDIVNLRQFYSSPLGRKVRRRLRRAVRHYWPAGAGLNMVGVGYTTELLPLPEAPAFKDSRILALMPHTQGAIYWPVESHNHSALADEMTPPFSPATIHRVLIPQAFEHLAAPEDFLRIWWQMLAPGGRMILMVTNRRGLWARLGATPFASGTPYTLSALRALLNHAGFTIRDARSALYVPPSNHPLWLALFHTMEWLGMLLCPRMGGVLILEAEKQIYAGVRVTPSVVKPQPQWAGATAMNASTSPRSHKVE